MNINEILTLIKERLLVPTLLVLITFAGGFGYIWNEHKEIGRLKDQLVAERNVIHGELLILEKNRADLAIQGVEVKAASERLAELRSLKPIDKSSVSSEVHTKQVAEATLLKLMSEYSALGIDLNRAPSCSHFHEEKPKYAMARAKLSEIVAVADAYALRGKFQAFFAANLPQTSNGVEVICTG